MIFIKDIRKFLLFVALGSAACPVSAANIQLDFSDMTPAVQQTDMNAGIRYNNVAVGIDAFLVSGNYSGAGASNIGSFASINQFRNTTSRYEMKLYKAGTTDLIDATDVTFNLILLDVDGLDSALGVAREAITVFTPVTWQLTADTEVVGPASNADVPYVFLSNNSNKNTPNPATGVDSLTLQQQRYSVHLAFAGQNTVEFELSVAPGGGTGRNFLIEGGFLSIPEPARGVLAMMGMAAMVMRRR